MQTDTRSTSRGNTGRPTTVLVAILLEAALVISWSGGFIGIRFARDYAPIFSILLWRSLVSGLLLLPFAVTIGPRIQWRECLSQMAFGAVAMAGYLGSFAYAISLGVPTGIVALITDMLPLMVPLSPGRSWGMCSRRASGSAHALV